MSKKRKKKLPLRDEFTDALNGEITERKIIERTQSKNEILEKEPIIEKISVENKIVEEIQVEKLPEKNVAVENVVAKNSVEKSTISDDLIENLNDNTVSSNNITTEKVLSDNKLVEKVPIEKVTNKKKLPSKKRSAKKNHSEKVTLKKVAATDNFKTDSKLEERILKEADNTFFDEKTPRNSEETPRTIFHSKAMRRWEAERKEEKLPPKIDPEPVIEPPRKLSRPEKFGVIVSVVMLIYAFVNFDKPLFFLAMALFVNSLRPAIGAAFGKHNRAVQNALHSFSIVVFFGALFFLFTD